MKIGNFNESGLKEILKQALKDDLTAETETRMRRCFEEIRQGCDHPDVKANRGISGSWAQRISRKEILAVASVLLLILGGVMHIRGDQTALAHSLEQLRADVAVSSRLNRSTCMNHPIGMEGAGKEDSRYRMR